MAVKSRGTLVKICGVTNAEDARWAVNLGADYVGINFYSESPRKVSIDKAKEIVESLPSFVKSVGVFVNPDLNELGKILKKAPIHILQLHGNETADEILKLKSNFNVAIWKVVKIQSEESLKEIESLAGVADMILLDTFKADQPGGTGETFDWEIAVKAKAFGIPVFLAGGLNPDNVEEAIEKVEPIGVDVASGVEKMEHPRKKDVEKMKSFILRAKGR